MGAQEEQFMCLRGPLWKTFDLGILWSSLYLFPRSTLPNEKWTLLFPYLAILPSRVSLFANCTLPNSQVNVPLKQQPKLLSKQRKDSMQYKSTACLFKWMFLWSNSQSWVNKGRIPGSTSRQYLLLFSLSAHGLIHLFWEKDGGCPECAYHLPKTCITGPKVCNGQHQNVWGHLQTHLGQVNGTKGKKKKQAVWKYNLHNKDAFAYVISSKQQPSLI